MYRCMEGGTNQILNPEEFWTSANSGLLMKTFTDRLKHFTKTLPDNRVHLGKSYDFILNKLQGSEYFPPEENKTMPATLWEWAMVYALAVQECQISSIYEGNSVLRSDRDPHGKGKKPPKPPGGSAPAGKDNRKRSRNGKPKETTLAAVSSSPASARPKRTLCN